MSRALLMFSTLMLIITSSAYAQTCANVDGNSRVDVADVVYMLNEHLGGPAIPTGKGDIDYRQGYNSGDLRFLLEYLFGAGPTPGCPPFPSYSLVNTDDSLILPSYLVPAGSGEFALPIYLINHAAVADIVLPLQVKGLSGTVFFDSLHLESVLTSGTANAGLAVARLMDNATGVLLFSTMLGHTRDILPGNNLIASAFFHYTSSPEGIVSMDTVTIGPHTFLNYVYGSSYDVGIPKVVIKAPDITNCPDDFNLDACAVYTHDFDVIEPTLCVGLTWSLVDPPTGASIDATTGAFTYEPPLGADALGAKNVTVRVIDESGAADDCQFTITVVNDAPAIVACPVGATVSACQVYTYEFAATDPNTCASLAWEVVSPEAGMSIVAGTGVFTYDPPAAAGICGTHPVTVKVSDEVGASVTCQFSIDVQDIAPVFTFCPTLNDPGQHMWDYWGETLHGTVAASDADAVLPSNGCPLALSYSGTIAGPGTLTVDPVTGAWSWPTIYNDPTYLGEHVVTITVSDGCKTATCTFTVEAVGIFATVAKQHKVIPGHYTFDSVYVYTGPDNDLGGFDLLIAYDASALNLHEVLVGSEIGGNPTNFNWEYFTYRFGATGNCNGACPSGLTRIVAIADMNNGFAHPDPSVYNVNGLVAVLKFLVTSDRNYQCQFAPVGFYWLDCTDNVLSSQNGQVAYISHYVWWYTGDYPPSDVIRIDNNPGGTSWDGYGGWGGILGEPNCLEGSGFPGKPLPHAWVDFYDGGIDIACSDSIDARGDLNLNGIANEIADAVIYTQYFLVGIDAFPLNGRQGAIAASDVNADGKTLTIGDLVYLLRVVVGDALPYAKLGPYSSNADINVFGDKISTQSSETIGALYLTFNVTGDNFTVVNHTNMEVVSNRVGDKLNVLVYSGLTNMSNAIPAGTNELLTVTGAQLNSVEASDYYGSLLNTRVAKTALPTQFSLSQNIPNPFNPTTKIGLDLPSFTGWQIDIYNVSGQLVQSYNGTNIGHVEVTWDASNTASGIYFYKVTAGSFTDTKKMVLMK